MSGSELMELVDPKDLRPHPLIKGLPRWDKEDPKWWAFVEDIREHGIRHPIQITAGNVVVDGETRRQGAIAAGVIGVPVEVVDHSEVNTIIYREMMLRRNLTKGAMAYLVVRTGILDGAFQEACQRQKQALKKGQLPRNDSVVTGTIEDVAASMGLSRDILFQARKCIAIFAEDDAYRVDIEPKIIAGEVGLGAVIAGYAGRKTTLGIEKNDRPQEILFRTGLRTLFLRASRYSDRTQIRVAVRAEIDQVEPDQLDLVEEVASTITRTIRKRRKSLSTE
jgi:hypothetical protein